MKPSGKLDARAKAAIGHIEKHRDFLWMRGHKKKEADYYTVLSRDAYGLLYLESFAVEDSGMVRTLPTVTDGEELEELAKAARGTRHAEKKAALARGPRRLGKQSHVHSIMGRWFPQ